MFKLKKLLPYTMAAILLSATASLPAMAAFEYDEPRTENERIELIDRLIVENQWRDALKHIAQALKHNPQNVQLKFKRAVIYSRMGDNPTAKRYFNELIRFYPEIVEPYNNLAAIYASEGNLVKARELLLQAVTINPNFSMGYENLGDLALQGKNPDTAQALQYYEKAASLAPDNKVLARKLKAFKKYLDQNS